MSRPPSAKRFSDLKDVPIGCIAAPTAYFAPRPEAKPVGQFNGTAFYYRAAVSPLRTPDKWKREGRTIKAGEKPFATRGGGPEPEDVFADWQTCPATC